MNKVDVKKIFRGLLMLFHADRSQRIVVLPENRSWIERKEGGSLCPLESLPGVVESSFVRLPPGSSLDPDSRDLEIFVLDGRLEVGGGVWPTGSYLRIAGESGLSVLAGEPSLLFLKAGTFPEEDRKSAGLETAGVRFSPGLVPGLSVLPLFSGGTANTALVRWEPGTVFQPHRHFGGEEILVISGTFEDEHGSYPAGSWYRAPHMSRHHPFSREGCLIFVKTGHLQDASAA